MNRQPYPSDVSDDEWAFVAPYVTLMSEDAPQREHALREVFNGLRYLVRTGAQWRGMPHDAPPWSTVYQQTQRWLAAGVFEAIVHDLRRLLREIAERAPAPRAALCDARTVQSTPESGAAAGWDGHKRRRGRTVHLAVDTLGHLLALLVTPQALERPGRGGGDEVKRLDDGDGLKYTEQGSEAPLKSGWCVNSW
jgi:transposase